jgi:RNA polymerase sigma factor (sigma-70 family)
LGTSDLALETKETCASARADAAQNESFEAIWRRENVALRRYCLRHVDGNVGDADEAVSRVAVRALQHSMSDVADAGAWLRRIARNVCVDLFRERRRERSQSIEELAAGGRLDHTAFAISLHTPEAMYFEREREQVLWRAVDSLPPALASLVRLYFVEDMLLADIAAETGMSEANVRRMIREACELVKAALRHAPPEPPGDDGSDGGDDAFGVAPPRRLAGIRFAQVVASSGRELDVYFALGERSVRFSSRTIAKLERYIARHPSGWRKRLQLARVLREQGDLARAVALYDEVLRRRPSHVLSWIELAESAAALHGAAASARAYRAGAAAVRPDARPLLEALAHAAEQGSRAAAERVLADRIPIGGSYSLAALARLFAAGGLVERAADLYAMAAIEDPHNAALLAAGYDTLRLAGRVREARENLARALAHDPSNVIALQRELLRRVSASGGTHDPAAPHETTLIIRRLAGLAGSAIDTIYTLALHWRAKGDARRASALADSLVRKHPHNAQAWHRFAMIREAYGAGAASLVAALRRSLELDPCDPAARVRLASALAATGETREALLILEALPRDRAVLVALSTLRCEPWNARWLEAVAERETRTNPTAGWIWLQLARARTAAGRAPAIVAATLQNAIELATARGDLETAAAAALELGRIEAERGDGVAASRWNVLALVDADALAADDGATASLFAGEALAALGDPHAAEARLRDAASLQPPAPLAARIRAVLRDLATAGKTEKVR